jgi:glycosyltransferase involved in cell wall biosynthesis
MNPIPPSVGVLIRFSTSAETLPGVLAALKQQTHQPDRLLGIDSGSQDGSSGLIEAAGGEVLKWNQRYEHSAVLNFGLRHLNTDLVLIVSSHTVLEAPDTLAKMVEAMRDPITACVSLKWDSDPYFSDDIDWAELRAKGLKLGSIYSNSMGMIRRKLWECIEFDESLPTAEDYAWALVQVRRGLHCKRLDLPFRYRRAGTSREGDFARVVFGLGRHHGLKVVWQGFKSSVKDVFGHGWLRSDPHEVKKAVRARLIGWIRSRFDLVPTLAKG